MMNAHSVRCPKCGARPGHNCLAYPDLYDIGPHISHSTRMVEALKVQEAQERARESPDNETEPFFGGFCAP